MTKDQNCTLLVVLIILGTNFTSCGTPKIPGDGFWKILHKIFVTPLFIYVCTLYKLQAGVGRPPRDLTDLLQDMMTAEVTGSSDLKENKEETTQPQI